MALGASAVTILGNHDLHLLALALCPGTKPRRRDTISDILAADDRDAIVDWLLQRPLAWHDPALNVTMVHAGVDPRWTATDTLLRAREVSDALGARDSARAFLGRMYGNDPARWDPTLTGSARLRCITNILTRMRYCRPDGALDLDEKRGTADAADGLVPWFALPAPAWQGTRVVFGHWSTLRLPRTRADALGVCPLDTGAVWGGQLTAMRLEDGVRFSVQARRSR